MSRIVIAPNIVTAFASQYLLDNIDYVQTEAIDITGAKSNVTAKVGLISDDGVRLDIQDQIDVVVMIEKEATRTFDNVQVKLTNSNTAYRYVLSQEVVSVTVQGPASAVEQLSANNISVEADVAGLESGSKSIKLTYNIAGTCYVQSIRPSSVTVIVQ